MTSGFQEGEDFVSARLNFDVDPAGLTTIRDLNTELERFRTNTEQAGRGVETFKGYIDILKEAQERTIQSSRSLMTILERVGGISPQHGEAGTAIPQGYSTPWAGVSAGMGGPERSRTPTTVPAASQQQEAWDHLATRDPRAYLGARAAWGGGTPGELPAGQMSITNEALDRLAARVAERDHITAQEEVKRSSQQVQHPGSPAPQRPRSAGAGAPWESWRNRAANWIGTAGSALGAVAPGGSGMGLMGMASRGLQSWGHRRALQDAAADDSPGGSVPKINLPPGAGFPSALQSPHEGPEPEEGPGGAGGGGGGGMGGLGHAAGWGGAALGIGAALFGAVQKTGSQIQQYRALGQIRGGGFTEGMGYEMQARMMAMNPFITNEQSRQIIQSALSSGYTGQEFDTVTKFMASNLKDMNLSVADSTKLLQQGVKGSTESMATLTKNMSDQFGAMKDLSRNGYATLPSREQDLMEAAPVLMGAGGTLETATGISGGLSQAFAGQKGMQGFGGELGAAAGGSMNFQYMMQAMGGPGGTALNIPGIDPGDPGSIMDALQGQGPKATTDAIWNTLHSLASMSPNVFVFQKMLQRTMGLNLNRQDAKKLYEMAKKVGSGGADDPLNAQGQYDDAVKGQQEQHQKVQREGGSILNQWNQSRGSMGGGLRVPPQGLGGGSNAISDQITNAYGGNAEVQGKDGKWYPFDSADPHMIEDLKSGKTRIRRHGEGGSGITLDQLPKSSDGNPDTGTGAGRSHSGKQSGMSGHLQITVKPESMRQVLGIPSHVPISQNEQAANSGYGTATKNNPPPGDSITTRGARGT